MRAIKACIECLKYWWNVDSDDLEREEDASPILPTIIIILIWLALIAFAISSGRPPG